MASIDMLSLEGIKAYVKDSNDSFVASILCVNLLFGMLTTLYGRVSGKNVMEVIFQFEIKKIL